MTYLKKLSDENIGTNDVMSITKRVELSMDGRNEMEFIRENVKVEWTYIGEGFCGDYDPTNPEDEPFLRFYISKREDDTG